MVLDRSNSAKMKLDKTDPTSCLASLETEHPTRPTASWIGRSNSLLGEFDIVRPTRPTASQIGWSNSSLGELALVNPISPKNRTMLVWFLENFPTLISSLPILTLCSDSKNGMRNRRRPAED
ncbi:hypothetical protein DY000_02015712 [Brassica cretica]|uniref:Uncharacterized protein n=1 Tax=Brassica cretica TaxID=69181 RepID=A0ABQ7CXP8_BRACR|nr:hypothetical protein DY000_02015712 [Brassica cretica]